jgi:hypothetical protein
MKFLFWVLSFALALSSCTTSVDLNFQNDPRILQGNWTMRLTRVSDGTLFSVPLNFVAVYQSKCCYTVTSPAVIEGVVYTLKGEFSGGGDYQIIQPQALPPALFGAELTDSNGVIAMRLRGGIPFDRKTPAERFAVSGEVYKTVNLTTEEKMYEFLLER